jgi:dCMP deaminase
VRPDWSDYYLGIARAVAARGDCSRAQHGAVIVKGHKIVATGYNGTPPGDKRSCLQGDCPRALLSYDELPSGSSYDTGPGTCISTHAEASALLRCSWDDMQDSVIYITGQPCAGCQKLIDSSGIKEVIW